MSISVHLKLNRYERNTTEVLLKQTLTLKIIILNSVFNQKIYQPFVEIIFCGYWIELNTVAKQYSDTKIKTKLMETSIHGFTYFGSF